MRFHALAGLLSGLCLSPLAAGAQSGCGGDFGGFVAGLRSEAVAAGHDAAAVKAFFAGVRQDG